MSIVVPIQIDCSFITGFRVQVKETEGLKICGAADLVLGDGRLALHTPDTGWCIGSGCVESLCSGYILTQPVPVYKLRFLMHVYMRYMRCARDPTSLL